MSEDVESRKKTTRTAANGSRGSNGARGAKAATKATTKATSKTATKATTKATAKTAAKKGTSAQASDGARQQLFVPVQQPTRVDNPLLEDETQRWWDAHDILNKYLHKNDNSPEPWSFIDGPITANNPMGVHHAWGRTYKDLWQRYHTMLGQKQRYQNGFDCQGLWVEVEVEKELEIKTKREIEEYGIAQFVEKCKERVLRFSTIQAEQSLRLGEWMDWSNSYFTMSDENNYTIWGFLKLCWERGWVYSGHDVMPWCPRCATGISDMEINEGRRETTHTSVYARFPLLDRPNEYLLVWTTTPWTLPANVAAAVNPDLTYAKVEQDGNTYYVAEEMAQRPKGSKEPNLHKLRGHEHGDFTVVGTVKGSEMLGWRYTGPFDELPAWQEAETTQGAEHRVIPWKDVSAVEGTGIVHIAPGCGREDFMLSKEEHEVPLVVLAPIDESGIYQGGYDWLTGQYAGDVARPVFDSLKQKGYFYQTESYRHVYPHCWRCGTELLFRLVDEWFISMGRLDDPGDNLRKRLVRIVEDPSMTWIPSFGRERELDWLRNMEDWMISKKRYWGLALPIYVCDECGEFEVVGGKEELRARAVEGWDEFEGHSPHRPWVDAVKIRCAKCGGLASRVLDVGNPWLDAGIVPFSTLHYRTDKAYWREWFPANFITESFPGQFRNWFYSMLVMAAGLVDEKPFEAVLGFATLLDQRGAAMHKSLGNSIPFDDAAAVVGADTMRWLYTSRAPEQNIRYPDVPSEEEVAALRAAGQPPRLSDLWLQIRGPLDKLWNVYSFFVTYANIDGFNPHGRSLSVAERSDLDRWVLSELQETIEHVTAHLEAFDAEHANEDLAAFIDNLSNWYVRRSRRRFWKSEEDTDKVAAYLTLYECLTTVTKLLAPFVPFLAESLYQNLVRSVDASAPESVHLCDWPKANAALVDARLRDETALVMRLVNLGRAAREKAQIRVRQPLEALYAKVATPEERASLSRLADQVLEELNVKRLELLPPESDMLVYTLRPKMGALGPKYGKLAQRVLAAARATDAQAAATQLRETGRLQLSVEGQEVVVLTEEVDVEASAREGFVAAEDRGYVVAIETTLTPELQAEGLARDLTHLIQEARKHAGLAIEDSITTTLWTDADLARIAETHRAYLQDETLSRTLTVSEGQPEQAEAQGAYTEAIPAAKLGGHAATVRLQRV